MPSAETTELFNCSCEQFFKIIADYDKYSEFLKEIKECRVVKEEGGKKLVEFHVSAIRDFQYKLWMTETPSSSITWTLESGDIFKSLKGSWELKDEGGKCRARYAVEGDFSIFVPGPIAKALMSVNLPNMIASYHKRIGKLYG